MSSGAGKGWIDNVKVYTSDTAQVPEFPTLALPILSVIGLMVVLRRRK